MRRVTSGYFKRSSPGTRVLCNVCDRGVPAQKLRPFQDGRDIVTESEIVQCVR